MKQTLIIKAHINLIEFEGIRKKSDEDVKMIERTFLEDNPHWYFKKDGSWYDKATVKIVLDRTTITKRFEDDETAFKYFELIQVSLNDALPFITIEDEV